MPLIPHEDYFFEERKGRGYFLLNGDVERLEDVAQQLKEWGWIVVKMAVSRYPSKKTYTQYDWFIEVQNDDGSVPHWTDFQEFAASYRPIDQQQREQEREQMRAELSQSRQQIEQLLDQTQYLQEGRAELEQRLRDISKEYQEIQQYYELFESDNTKLAQENKELRERIYALEGKNEYLESVVDSYQSTKTEAVVVANYQTAFETFFPMMELLRQSIDILASWRNPATAVKVLMQIATGEQIGKRFQAAGKDWFEVSKVSNGQDDSGRIYYRCLKEDQGTKYQVLISIKERQDNDAEYLSKL